MCYHYVSLNRGQISSVYPFSECGPVAVWFFSVQPVCISNKRISKAYRILLMYYVIYVCYVRHGEIISQFLPTLFRSLCLSMNTSRHQNFGDAGGKNKLTGLPVAGLSMSVVWLSPAAGVNSSLVCLHCCMCWLLVRPWWYPYGFA